MNGNMSLGEDFLKNTHRRSPNIPQVCGKVPFSSSSHLENVRTHTAEETLTNGKDVPKPSVSH